MGRWDWGQLAIPAIYILLIGVGLVFAHSGLQGDQGLSALRDAEALERELEGELAHLESRRRALENKIERLDAKNLDLDLLDERARAVLGYVGRGEIRLP